ncbi:uncharacterized protein EI90DRAFT_3053664 [Cantharellus anzutake]|uniref:uncharacterized protein n=1 Tax=Cantharellus anzutake TaxID=1750568 RepID=UPI001907834D|nr:uncharacterized protein EI90DRAFT_3053664 [Cantharellus anzutake]KAF8332586.1 hypothetical protein EI90DRAFT_3053664 [Cantharellus anzutake]
MHHKDFHHLLSLACTDKKRPVRVQWDPERTPTLGVLPYRSIQIGIGRQVSEMWVNEMIVAKALKDAIEKEPDLELDELIKKGLMPVERPYQVSEDFVIF